MPQESPPSPVAKLAQTGSRSEPEGDIRRGGWILVLVGVVLVLIAAAWVLLF